MKKIIISIAAASVFLFTGCFTDSDTATVRINLGNLPVAKVEKKSLIDRFLMIFAKEAVAQEVPEWLGITVVHLGAFDENNKLLAKKRIKATPVSSGSMNTYVEFDVPARSGIRIVVLGEQEEQTENFAEFYGCSVPLNLTAGDIEEVEVQMEYLTNILGGWSYIYEINFWYEGEPGDDYVVIKWDRLYGVSNYILKFGYENDFEVIYKGSNEELIYYGDDLNDGSYQIELEFKFARINSDAVDFDF
ncbi:MAG: hypothetical protein WDA74_05875 [Spirochaetota bacterium]